MGLGKSTGQSDGNLIKVNKESYNRCQKSHKPLENYITRVSEGLKLGDIRRETR
jgi:hypothetical protein